MEKVWCDLTIWAPWRILLVSSQVVRWGHVTGSSQWNVSVNDTCCFRTEARKDWWTSLTIHLSLPWQPWRPWDKMLVDKRVPRSLSAVWQSRSNQPILDFAWMRYASFTFVRVCWVMSDVCDLVDYIPPGSSVCGIFQARILEWVAYPFSRDLPDPGIEPASLALAGRFFTTEPPGKFLSLAPGSNLN